MTVLQSSQVERRDRIKQGVVIGILVALLVLLMWAANLFATVRLSLSNTFFVAAERSEDVVIVALDDDSLREYGRSPAEWDRSLYADLIDLISAAEARVVAFDLIFAGETDADAIFAARLAAARTSDNRLRVVMPLAGAGNTSVEHDMGMVTFSNVLRPVDVLAEQADYLAFVNTFADVDGTVRRQTSQIRSGDENGLSLSLATYLAYLRIPSAAVSQVVSMDGDVLHVTPERQLTVDENGLWLQNFFGAPEVTFPIFSMQAVLENEVALEKFSDKIVLVGLMNAQGATDRYPSPASESGQPMAGVEIQAHAIETLVRGMSLHEQSRISQAVTIFVLAIGSSILYALLRWYAKIIMAVVLLLGWFVMASVIFTTQQEVVNLLHPGLAIVLPVAISIGMDITSEIRRRQRKQNFYCKVW